MNGRSARNAASRNDDIFQTLESCVRGTLAESYFVPEDDQPDAEMRPQSSPKASDEVLKSDPESDRISTSADTNMRNKEREGRTPADQFKLGFETAKREPLRKIKIEPPLTFKEHEEPRIDPEEVAKALGAEAIEGIHPDSSGWPVSEYTLRQERSRPGKPSRK